MDISLHRKFSRLDIQNRRKKHDGNNHWCELRQAQAYSSDQVATRMSLRQYILQAERIIISHVYISERLSYKLEIFSNHYNSPKFIAQKISLTEIQVSENKANYGNI